MAIVLTDVGADWMLVTALAQQAHQALTLRLFTGVPPIITTAGILSNFTQASGGGYVEKSVPAGSFTLISAATDPSTIYTAEDFMWTFTGATTAPITGWMLVAAGTTLVMWDYLYATSAPTVAIDFSPLAGDTLKIAGSNLAFSLSKGTPTTA